jgi:uncharacterized protein YjiS (DUF1127 family)
LQRAFRDTPRGQFVERQSSHPRFRELCGPFDRWRRGARARNELARMSMCKLQDIGISPAERDRERGERF